MPNHCVLALQLTYIFEVNAMVGCVDDYCDFIAKCQYDLFNTYAERLIYFIECEVPKVHFACRWREIVHEKLICKNTHTCLSWRSEPLSTYSRKALLFNLVAVVCNDFGRILSNVMKCQEKWNNGSTKV